MKINTLRILNYKSFHDSGPIRFSEGFNIILGQNSSGKTALLEAFRTHRIQHKPTLLQERSPNEPLNPVSRLELEISFSRGELKNEMLRSGVQVHFPVRNLPTDPSIQIKKMTDEFFDAHTNVLKLGALTNNIVALHYPSHGLFDLSEQRMVSLTPRPDKQDYDVGGLANSGSDNLPTVAQMVVDRKVYVFRPERMNIGEIGFQEESLLADDARNLPRVLQAMSANPALFARYKRHVNQVFPYIKDVTLVAKGNNIEVRIWWVDPSSERVDLAIPLLESGTGISQVLAILYVAMTIENGVIVIDEPNAFLNSGAAKTLVKILSQYNHQYIVSTHSPEVIAAANPATLLAVKWHNGKSSVEALNARDAQVQQMVLSELGVSSSDIFGLDRIVWVEGVTEQDCFPLILQKQMGTLPQGLAFVSVRSVDEIARKQGVDLVVLDVYARLTEIAASLPKALHFSFDRERRSEEYIAKVEVETKGKVKFLPARHYECFLIHERSLSALMSAEAVKLEKPEVSEQAITKWLSENAQRFDSSIKWTGTTANAEWRSSVDAAHMLNELFKHFLQAEYRKTTHSFALTEWLLDKESEFMSELSAYVVGLVK